MQAPQDQDVFQADRALLNPTFEAYKLLTGGVTSKSYRLPSAVNHPEQPQGLHVSRKVLQDQAGLNHLVATASSSSHVCAYIDESGFVVLTDLSDATKPTFHPLRCLELRDDGSHSQQTSLVALPGDQWLAAGAGTRIELLEARKGQHGGRWSAEVLASWQPEGFGGRLLQARRSETDPNVILALVQDIRTTRAGDTSQVTVRSTHKTTFEVALVELRLPPKEENAEQPTATAAEPTVVKPTWTVWGDDPVYHCQLGPSAHSQHLLVAESTFLEPEKHAAAAAPTPTTTKAPAGGTATASDSSTFEPGASTSSTRPTRPPRPPPLFTWHQTPDTVTLIFPLPPSVTKSDVRVHFSPPSGLSVHLAPHADLTGSSGSGEGRAGKKAKIFELREGEEEGMQEQEEGQEPSVRTAHALQEGRYANRTLWAPIDTSGCVWTWERVNTTKSSSGQPSQQQQQGLLSIFLEKKDEGTRWSAVFDEAERRRRAGDEDDDEDDPPETQDHGDLLSMVQNMDKYTVDVDEDEADEGKENPLFNTQRDSLLHDGLEAEDADVGRPACMTAISSTGEGAGAVVVSHPPQDQRQASCLARPLPGSGQAAGDGPLVIRRDLDGLVFAPSRQDEQAWQHLTTLPALSFVLASKRDLRAVYVASPPPPTTPTSSSSAGRTAVLAFEDAPRVAGESADSMPKSAGNLFVYYTAAETKGRNAPSRVIRLGGGEGGGMEGTGSLMGAAALNLTPAGGGGDGSGSKRSLVVLCEKALLVLRGVLDDEEEGAGEA